VGRRNIGRVGRNRADFGCPEPGSAAEISFFSWRDKKNGVLILLYSLVIETVLVEFTFPREFDFTLFRISTKIISNRNRMAGINFPRGLNALNCHLSGGSKG